MGYILHTLTAVLVVLKLLGTIQVSWWLALAPSLFGIGMALLFLTVAGLVLVAAFMKGR